MLSIRSNVDMLRWGGFQNQQSKNSNVSNYKFDSLEDGRPHKRADALKCTLKKNEYSKIFLLLAALLGTSMIIRDGILLAS